MTWKCSCALPGVTLLLDCTFKKIPSGVIHKTDDNVNILLYFTFTILKKNVYAGTEHCIDVFLLPGETSVFLFKHWNRMVSFCTGLHTMNFGGTRGLKVSYLQALFLTPAALSSSWMQVPRFTCLGYNAGGKSQSINRFPISLMTQTFYMKHDKATRSFTSCWQVSRVLSTITIHSLSQKTHTSITNTIKASERELKFYIEKLNSDAKMPYTNILKPCAYTHSATELAQ